MKLMVIAAAVLAASACGGGGGNDMNPDSGVSENPVTGFTFAAVGDRSFASFGWAGTFHDLEVPDGTPFSVRVTGTGCSVTGSCPFEGPTQPRQMPAVNRQRCLNRMSKTCTADADCADGTGTTASQRCVFIYDPPTSTPLVGLGGQPGACGWSYIPVAAANNPATIRGTFNIQTGELNIEDMTLFIALNGPGGGYRGGCAECVGDVNPNDGKKDGTCMKAATNGETSPDLGQKCDVNRFGNVPGYSGSYSMDCSPTVTSTPAAPDQQNAFGGKFTSSGYRVAVTAASPNCSVDGMGNLKCVCGMCPDRAGRPPTACFTNADCGGDQCGAIPDGCDPNPLPIQANGQPDPGFDNTKAPNQCKNPAFAGWFASGPNSCKDPGCNWDATKGVGTCISRLDGRTRVGCYPAPNQATEIVAPGGSRLVGSVFVVDTATARCTRSFPLLGSPAQQQAAAATNAQLGLPGLTFQRRSFRVIPERDVSK